MSRNNKKKDEGNTMNNTVNEVKKNGTNGKEKVLTRREQEIPPTSTGGGMNCDKHGVLLTFVSHSIIIIV